MTAEKLKVPLHEDVSDFEKYHRKKRSRKMQILAGVCILVILNVSLFVFTLFYTLSRVRIIECKLESLKNVVSEMDTMDADATVNAIERLNERWNNIYQSLEKTAEVDTEAIEDQEQYDESDENSIYFDYDIDNQLQLNDTEYDNKDEGILDIKYAMDLTKQGNESSRIKRNIIATTQDGVLINSESYAQKRARNITRSSKQHPTTRYSPTRSSSSAPYYWQSRQQNSTSHMTTPYITPYRRNQVKHTSAPPVYVRRSRVKHTEDKSKAFRQVVKKSSLKSGDTFTNGDGSSDTEFTVVRDENMGRRRYRPLEILDERHPRVGRIRLPSIHYSGDTSRYVVGQHTNFNGNGHLRHPQRTFIDWKISDWVKSSGMDTHFSMDEGVVTIKESGVYFIYAQIYYLDEHDTIGFRVHKNNESILQCTVTAHSAERRLKGNTCYTAGMEYLSDGDTISLADITNGRYSLFEPGKSFFGLVKFSDIKIK